MQLTMVLEVEEVKPLHPVLSLVTIAGDYS
jgi:hypothetical protein